MKNEVKELRPLEEEVKKLRPLLEENKKLRLLLDEVKFDQEAIEKERAEKA